jgi:hypothetical protein
MAFGGPRHVVHQPRAEKMFAEFEAAGVEAVLVRWSARPTPGAWTWAPLMRPACSTSISWPVQAVAAAWPSSSPGPRPSVRHPHPPRTRALWRAARPGPARVHRGQDTFKDPTTVTEADRNLLGQRDHVRLYATGDYMKRLEKAGFSGLSQPCRSA